MFTGVRDFDPWPFGSHPGLFFEGTLGFLSACFQQKPRGTQEGFLQVVGFRLASLGTGILRGNVLKVS